MYEYEDGWGLATEAEAHAEWHRNSGVPMGTPGCPQDACHVDYDAGCVCDEPIFDGWAGECRRCGGDLSPMFSSVENVMDQLEEMDVEVPEPDDDDIPF